MYMYTVYACTHTCSTVYVHVNVQQYVYMYMCISLCMSNFAYTCMDASRPFLATSVLYTCIHVSVHGFTC